MTLHLLTFYQTISNAEDSQFWVTLGLRKYMMLTSGGACAFPSEDEYPARFPIAAILPQTMDMYEEKCSFDVLNDYRRLRKQSSMSWEQIAVLVAMAQSQAQVLDIKRFEIDDPRLNVFEVRFSRSSCCTAGSTLTVLRPS